MSEQPSPFPFPPSFDKLAGLNVVVSHWLPTKEVQFRFPRSKKKRIRKKWAKNPKNWKAVDGWTAYQVGNTLIVPPKVYAELTKRMMDAAEKRLIESLGVPEGLFRGDSSAPSIGSALSEATEKAFARIMESESRKWLSWIW